MDLKKYFKKSYLGFIAIISYFILNNLQGLPFSLLGIDVNNIPLPIKVTYLLIFELLIATILFIIYRKQIITDFKDLKQNHKKYFSECFKYWLIGLMIMYASNFIIMFVFDSGLSENEEAVRNIFKISPLYIYISAVIFAPIIEELVFRNSIRYVVPNKYLFIFLSGFLFGLAHLGYTITSFIDVLTIIPYGALGWMFAIMLEKTNNIFVSMGFHLMHNGILINLQFLLLFFS